VLRRSAVVASCLATLIPTLGVAAAPVQPPQYFVVCASAPNLPTVYLSGIVQAAPPAFPQVRSGFADYLAQRYSYKGAVACAPTNSLANAQKAVEARSGALRNAKKNVVETGWTEGAANVAAQIGAALSPGAAGAAATQALASPAKPAAAAAAAAGRTGAAHAGAAGSAPAGGATGAQGGSDLSSTLSSIFGAAGSGCSGGGGGGGSAGGTGKGKAGGGEQSGGGGSGCQSPFNQVSSTLTTLFGAGAGAAAGGGSPAGGAGGGESRAAPPAAEGLGSAEAQSTRLVVYGCGRHDTEVACVTDLTNQNQKETLVSGADAWKDTFIVDDRGDRHPRSKGVFLNVDGEQRSQLDIGYGKSARYVLMFEGVQARVQKVTLRSASGALNVADISLAGPEGAPPAAR